MGDYNTAFHHVDNPLEHVGYCPQVNPLWPRVTLREHLEIYAAIKGLQGEDVPGIISRCVQILRIYLHNDPGDKTILQQKPKLLTVVLMCYQCGERSGAQGSLE